jgi:hypothetical protein
MAEKPYFATRDLPVNLDVPISGYKLQVTIR